MQRSGSYLYYPSPPQTLSYSAQLPVSHPEEYRLWKHVRLVCYNRVETPKEEALYSHHMPRLALTGKRAGVIYGGGLSSASMSLYLPDRLNLAPF